MAQFGRRFRKARARRQRRRNARVEARVEKKRIKQSERTARVQARQQGKSSRIASKAQGGFFLPQSVQARQDSLMSGIKTAGSIGLGIATGGTSTALGALGTAFGGMGGSPYGNGFATSGMESEYYDVSDNRGETQLIAGIPNEFIYLAGGGIVLYFLTRRK